MPRFKCLSFVLCCLLLWAAPAAAEELIVRLDPASTEVTFDLDATGHDVHGAFSLASGEIRFDPATGAVSGEIRVNAQGAETGNNKRDKTMHKKVLESEKFPFFVFKPQRIEGSVAAAGTSEVNVKGTLSIHGQDHPLTLPTTVDISGDRVSATTHFGVPFVAWGMENPSFLFLRVSKTVDVTVSATGRAAAATRAAR